MTANEMIPVVGQTVELNADGLYVSCTVADVKFSWGRPRLLLRPVTGSGERWVELSSIRPSRVPRYQVSADYRERPSVTSCGRRGYGPCFYQGKSGHCTAHASLALA